MAAILLIENGEKHQVVLSDLLSVQGNAVTIRSAGNTAATLLEETNYGFDLVLTSITFASPNAVELMGSIKRHSPHLLPVLLLKGPTLNTEQSKEVLRQIAALLPA